MNQKVNSKVIESLTMLADANAAMYDAIMTAVHESDNGIVTFIENENGKYDTGEERFIKYNEDGELMMFDNYDNELVAINDLSADDLYDICIQL